jgi:hypothetical protein
MGRAGFIQAGRSFLIDEVNLQEIANATSYENVLDELANRLRRKQKSFVRRGPGWGPARKFLNIFMRDAFYNIYLHKAYGLAHLESKLEFH